MRTLALSLMLLLAGPAAWGQTPTTLTEAQIRDLIRQASDHDIENDKRQRDYTYIEREEEHKLNGKGDTKSVESRTHEIMMLYQEPIERLIAKDDQPLSSKDAAKEKDRIHKVIENPNTQSTNARD